MDENAELQAKIANLAARINRHKHSKPNTIDHGPAGPTRRVKSYGPPRGRVWKAYQSPHRNRTLVLNKAANKPGNGSSDHPVDEQNPTGSSTGWVSKHDRHMQLINNSVYKQVTEKRTSAIEQTRKQKFLKRDEQEKEKLQEYLHNVTPPSPEQPDAKAPHSLVISNIRFIVTDGGSKLVRANNESNLGKYPPRRVNIGGVIFLRSKHGNLYRAGLVKASRRAQVKRTNVLCEQFSTTGTCPKGPACRFTHDPNKVAICRDFLQTGNCLAGDACDLSHDLTLNRVPACLHFLRGSCTNPTCRYAHITTKHGAPVCRAFATYGYCDNGNSCSERHVHECPDYANKGVCRNKKCRLPHVDRAGQLRKATARQSIDDDESSSSDINSDEESMTDDVDSDEMTEEILPSRVGAHELSQQQDFIQF